MAQTEAENGGEKEKNVLKLIWEEVKAAALMRLKAQLTKLEYDPNKGMLGKRLKELKLLVGGVESGVVADPLNTLKEAGEKYKKIIESRNNFQRKRAEENNPDGVQNYFSNRGALSGEAEYANEAKGVLNDNRAQVVKREKELEEVKNKPEAEKNEAIRRISGELEKEISKDETYWGEADEDFDREIEKQLEKIERIENSRHELKGASGLFSVQAEGVFNDLSSLVANMDAAAKSHPEMAMASYGKIKTLMDENASKLSVGDREMILKRIGEVERKHAGLIAASEISRGAAGTPTPERQRQRNELVGNLTKRANNGDKNAEQALNRILSGDDEPMEEGKFRQYLDSLFKLRDKRADLNPPDHLNGRRMELGDEDIPPEAFGAQYFPPEGGDITSPETYTGEQLWGTPEHNYRMIKKDVLSRYGELNKTTLEAYIQKQLTFITRSQGATFEHSNIQRKIAIQTLLNDDEILDPKVWGLKVEEKGALIDQVYGLMAMHDFGWGAMSGNMEQIWGMSQRVGMLNWINSYDYGMEFKVRVQGRENPIHTKVEMADLANLLEYKYWADLALNQHDGVRATAATNMSLYLIAKQIGGWNDEVNGLVDFGKKGNERFKVEKIMVEGKEAFKVSMVGQRDVIITGYQDLEKEVVLTGRMMGRGRVPETTWGNNKERTASELGDQLLGFGWTAQVAEKSTGRMAYFDLQHKGDVNDKYYKYQDDRYTAKYNVALHQEIMMATDPRRRDLVTMTYFKALRPAYERLAQEYVGLEAWKHLSNREKAKQIREFQDFMDYSLKNSKNWLMTKETMLNNWDTLMKERKVTNDLGQKADRFAWMPSGDDRERAHYLMEKYMDKDINWAPLITIMMGGETIPTGAATRGIGGFRTAIEHWDRRNVYQAFNTAYKVWNPNDGDESKKGHWRDDFDKHFDYLSRIVKGYALRRMVAQNPTFANITKLMEESGEYDAYSVPERGRKVMQITNETTKLQQTQISTDIYETDNDESLVMFDPGEHEGVTGVRGDGVNEEGVQLYEKRKFYFDSRGRKMGWHKPAFMRKEEIHQMMVRGNLTHHQYDEMISQNLEHIWGWYPKSRLGKTLWGGDPMARWADHKYVGFLSHRIRWGIGPTISWFRVFWSEIDKGKWWSETWEQWAEIIGHETKKSLQPAGGH